ncbi:MAG: corrinoid protein [Dehalococcoidia bacterium]
MADIMERIAEALIIGKIDEVGTLSQEALDNGATPEEVMSKGLFAGMDVVSTKFKNQDMFIPEVLRSAKAMHAGMDVLKPVLTEGADSSMSGTVVIATVEGDLHDIGKNLAAMMLEGAGFRVINLGIDQKAKDIVKAVKENNPKILGLSALLTTTMPRMPEVIEALKQEGIRDQVKVIIGGAPVTQEFADEIGADAYAANAALGADKAKELL